MIDFKPTEYSLFTVASSREFNDTGWVLSDPISESPSLVRSLYKKKQIDVKSSEWGFYRFADWLPVHRMLAGSATTVTYKSEHLAKELGLKNLYIAFSGYWPEKGAYMQTCSFKETEAYSVCGRIQDNEKRVLTVASAGNTARAFAKVCSDNNIPLLLFVPEGNIDALWFEKPVNPCVKLVSPPKGCDYFDAIALSKIAAASPRFLDEGGATNVARRDGMGTTLLSAAVEIGRIPDIYVQAIGSGTGGIAAWEAAMRLAEDGRFGENNMKLLLVQNAPFTPMADAWREKSRDLLSMDEDQSRTKALAIVAKVLANRKPPYSIAGGVFDAVTASGGDIVTADNNESQYYCDLFEKCEGIDVYHAVGIAIAGLHKELLNGKISGEETILLNVTGGGEAHFKSSKEYFTLKPSLIADPTEKRETLISKFEKLFD